MIALKSANMPPAVIPTRRKGSRISQIMGYNISTNRAIGHDRMNRINQSRILIILRPFINIHIYYWKVRLDVSALQIISYGQRKT
jgi:hypothetical protein